jgi:hypothetical protein
MYISLTAVRVNTLRLLRRMSKDEPEYVFEKAKAFQKDEDPAVVSELLALFADLLPRYFQESLPIVRRSLSQDPARSIQASTEVLAALQLLSRAMSHYPDLVFQLTAEYLRQYFGERDLMLYSGEYPLDRAFKLLGDYVLIDPQTNLRRTIGILEERFKKVWSRDMKPDVPYDGMKGLGLIVAQTGFGPPRLVEDSMVSVSLISPLLVLEKDKPESALELAQSLIDDSNAFARRAALHVALKLSVAGNTTADKLIEKVFDVYIDSHEYLSVFQTAESCLVPLAEKRPRLAMKFLKKLASAGLQCLESFEIAALLDLAEAEGEARVMLMRILEKGSPSLAPQIISGVQRLAESLPEFVESVLQLTMKRFEGSPSIDTVSTVLHTASTLARTSWNHAEPVFELVIKSPSWIQGSDIARRLADVAKANPDVSGDVRRMLQGLIHDPSPYLRQTTIMAAVELRETEGAFGLALLESLSTDPNPSPQEDEQLLDSPVGGILAILTVRGAVAWSTPYFRPVDMNRCWNLLAKLSADDSAYVRTMAVRSLELCERDSQYIVEVMSLLISGGPSGAGLLRDESAWVRHGSLRLVAYQLFSDPKSIDTLYSPLRNALQDASPRVQSEAAQRVLDAAAISRDSRYQELLQEIAEHGNPEERSEVAFSVRSYMDKDERGAFEYFKPIFARLISDPQREVRERAALSLEDWAEAHPSDVAGWCCSLVETEARLPTNTSSGMSGYYIFQAFRSLVPAHPEQAVIVLECVQRLPDIYWLNEILGAAEGLPPGFRTRVRPIADALLRKGLPAAQKLLDSWSKAET